MKNSYFTMILKARTVQDCERILQTLVNDPDIGYAEYLNTYAEVEARARQIKVSQEKLKKEHAARIATKEKMAPHFRA